MITTSTETVFISWSRYSVVEQRLEVVEAGTIKQKIKHWYFRGWLVWSWVLQQEEMQ